MKRTLLLITAMLVALSLFFAGCQDPVTSFTVTNSDELLEIAGPAWVRAEAIKGANIVTWALVKDAATYTVYRQPVDGNSGIALAPLTQLKSVPNSDGTVFWAVDAVGIKNQLVDGASYVYSVVASTSATFTGRAINGTYYTKDGITYAAPVTADIPALGSPVTSLLPEESTLSDADITAEKIQKLDSNEELLVSWPSLHPMFKYTVNYGLGNATLSVDITDDAFAHPSDLPRLGSILYHAMPLFGGNTEIKLGVSFNEDEYYYKPELITKAVTGLTVTEPLPGQITSFSASRDTDPRIAKIKWDLHDASWNPSDYKLYRIEISPYYSSEYQYTATGDWAAVTGTVDLSGSTVTLTEYGLDPLKTYLYGIYVEFDGRKSVPQSTPLKPAGIAQPGAFAVIPTYTTDDDIRTYRVTIGWSAQPGAAYELFRAEKTTYPDSSLGAFSPITIPAAVAGRHTVIDKPAIRKAYVYRLAVTVAGVTTYFDEDLNDQDDYAFAEYVTGTLSVNPSATNAYSTSITLNVTGYYNDLTADIYRAEVPKNASPSPTPGYFTNSVEKEAFTRIKENHSLKSDGTTYTDSGLTMGTQYVYRVVYKLGATELVNKHGDLQNNAGCVQIPSVPSVTYLNKKSVTNGTSKRDYFTVNEGTAAIGANVIVQRRSTNTETSVTSQWTTFRSAGNIVKYTNTAELKWGDEATGIFGTSFYFYFDTTTDMPTEPANTTYAYRVVVVNGANAQNYAELVPGVPGYTW